MIEVSNVKKTLSGEQILHGVSFTAPSGKITGFLGPNGAGKTTTFKVALNLMQPDNSDASVTFDGEPLNSFPMPFTKVGASLEVNAMDKRRKAVDHLKAYAPLADCPDSRIDQLLDDVGLGHAKKKRVGSYSMGMKQRLALAMTMLGDPDFLVLDEPANGLDPDGIVWLREHLRALADQGKTIVVSSHLLNEAQRFIDYAVIIKNGRVEYEGDLERLNELCREYTGQDVNDLEEAYRIVTARGE